LLSTIVKDYEYFTDNEYRVYAEKSGKPVETDVGIFLQFVSPSQMIGITGTKGKSTTSNLIYYALKDQFEEVILAGNIGKSVLDCLELITDSTKVILELSSFQLEACAKHHISPHIAVITNILPDHLNYYSSMDEYSQAKKVIGLYQKPDDYLFIQKDDSMVDTNDFLSDIHSQISRFSVEDLPEEFEPTLLGGHNLANYAAALKVVAHFKLTPEQALKSMNRFEGADFRLQLVKKIKGTKIYNDSASTMPDSTIKALEAIKSPILIVGGMDKGLPYEKLAHEIDRRVKAVYFIDGTATEKLRPLLQHRNIIRSIYTDLDLLLKDLKLEIKEGDTILFSPGATSFNFFQNEFDRGQKFNQAVERIFK
jgi:UDP-N-acetylmuramoylalanine--D-glutamate ligase